jgi:hypothetical protein
MNIGLYRRGPDKQRKEQKTIIAYWCLGEAIEGTIPENKNDSCETKE